MRPGGTDNWALKTLNVTSALAIVPKNGQSTRAILQECMEPIVTNSLLLTNAK